MKTEKLIDLAHDLREKIFYLELEHKRLKKKLRKLPKKIAIYDKAYDLQIATNQTDSFLARELQWNLDRLFAKQVDIKKQYNLSKKNIKHFKAELKIINRELNPRT